MGYAKFLAYNVIGAVAWVLVCVLAGSWFGNLEVVRKNFELVLLAIIGISVLPMVIEFMRARRAPPAA
jgi:membrane-associated protein